MTAPTWADNLLSSPGEDVLYFCLLLNKVKGLLKKTFGALFWPYEWFRQ